MKLRPLPLAITAAACFTTAAALGQALETDPQQQALRMPQPRPGLPLTILPEAPGAPADPRIANLRITLASVRIEGTRALDGRALSAALGQVAGRSFDLAGLRQLAVRVQELARSTGLPEARVHMPPQNLAGGILRVVVEDGPLVQAQVPGGPSQRPAPPPPADPGISNLRVILSSVRIEGTTELDPAALAPSVEGVAGRSYDVAGLRDLAAQVQDKARSLGYGFARAYLPPQDLAEGILRIVVDEGRFGQVQATGAAAAQAQPWLAPLKPGGPIRQEPFERALLLLEQLPGVQVQATLSPGSEPGTGDLQVKAQAHRETTGEVGLDNHGNQASGSERLRASLQVGSPLGFGDQLSLSANTSRLGTWLGSLSYSLPVGAQGLRASFGASRSDYELGEEFASLQAHGTSNTLNASLSYPLVLKLAGSVTVSAGLQHRQLHDQFDAAGVEQRKKTQSLPLSLNADARDERGMTWGSLTLTVGRLQLDAAQQAQDDATARTAGRFSRLNVDAARMHQLAKGWTLYGRVSGQWASKNLDASEKFSLGGPHAVRAWPAGETLGDEGGLGQFELRYRMDAFEPYLFVDAGSVRINHSPWADGANSRSLSGAGLGMRWVSKDWSFEGSLGWRGSKAKPTSDPDAGAPQLWVNLGRRF